MSSISVAYVPDLGENQIMLEMYTKKMEELKELGAEKMKAIIHNKIVLVVEQVANTLYQQLSTLVEDTQARDITSKWQLFSWFASEWEKFGESTDDKGGKVKKQPHFFVQALINPDIGLFKYGEKCYFHSLVDGSWKQNVYFIHKWEQREIGYSAAVALKRQNLTEVWTNRKAICLYSAKEKFTALQRGKQIDFDYGYTGNKDSDNNPSFLYVEKQQKNVYRNVFGYDPADFKEDFERLLAEHDDWHGMDMVELQNILTETLILFHELIHVLTNTAHQSENQANQASEGDEVFQDPEVELFPAMPEDYPLEEFTVEDWPDMGEAAKDYIKALGDDDEAAKEFLKKGDGVARIWPFFTDGDGHGVEFCNMNSLFAGMLGQTTLCSVIYEKRKTRIALQKQLPGGLKRPETGLSGHEKPPAPRREGGGKQKYVRKQEEDGTTTWAKQLYIKLRF